MSRLTDRRGGFVAEAIRRRMEGTRAHQVGELERRVDALEHVLAYRLRGFRGVRLESTGVVIEPDSDGWLAFSSDGNLAISRDPNEAQNHAKWKLTAEIPEAGCSAAIVTNADCDGTERTATGCGAKVTHQTGNGYVAVQLTGTGDAQVLAYNWCAPPTVAPQSLTGDWTIRDPDGWLELANGDECGADCTAVKVPYWVDAP